MIELFKFAVYYAFGLVSGMFLSLVFIAQLYDVFLKKQNNLLNTVKNLVYGGKKDGN